MAFPKKYSDEIREKAVRRVVERRQREPRNRAILREVAEEFDVGEQSLRIWVNKLNDGVFDGGGAPPTGAEREEDQPDRAVPTESLLHRIAKLEAELKKSREEVAVLKSALAIFAADQVRQGPPVSEPR